MSTTQNYLLLIDREENVLELQETALKYFYGGEIVLARTHEDAIKSLEKLGKPEIIISDIKLLFGEDGKLHQYLKENCPHLPLIATSAEEKFQRPQEMTLISTMLSKPVCPEKLSHLVKSFTKVPIESPTHVPIKLRVARDVASGKFDFYLKLSGTNFVKITNQGTDFTDTELMKLSSKGITEIYIKASESHEFLRIWEQHLHERLFKKGAPLDSALAIQCLEQVERIAHAFGWSVESIKASQKIVKEAIATLNRNETVSALLKKKFEEKGSSYTQHVGLLCYLSCIMCAELNMEEAQEKLVMASLMHDLSIDETYYPKIEEWNKLARDLNNRSPEVVKYRLHPLYASQIAQSIDILPPDVDQIILQHHESADGKGFPRGLTASRIHYLSSIFIMAEDLIHFLDDGESLETSLKDYLTWGEDRYQNGNFKKIFEGIKSKVA